jgi:EAL domain-containing protein (putative c-di-GMP-specific phosphodiesterase class I)/FixJ family two-component response regulator
MRTSSDPAEAAPGLRAGQLSADLDQALARGELSLRYQPQVSLADGRIIGAEALLRWQHPALGEVSPAEFVPLAERSGSIVAIGRWVLREALAQVARWRQAGLHPVRVGVNVSPLQFQAGDMVRQVREALRDSGIEPTLLGIEVTEGALLHNPQQVAQSLAALRQIGVEIALDDFGTGFSNLSRLHALPLDLLKIDRSFVSDVTVAAESASVTRSIILLAHGLKIRVLAEGAETEAQAAMLATHGCDRLQGHVFSPAIDAQAFGQMLAQGQQLPSRLTHGALRSNTLLLVDDEDNILAALRRLFRRDGYRILTASSGAEGLELLARNEVDVIVSDQRMPGMTGVDFLRRCKVMRPETIRMTLSGFTDLQSIIDAVNEGAVYKFLTKPWDDERLREHVAQAFQQKRLVDENARLHQQVTQANADLARMNQRLEGLLARQREQVQLMEDSAGSARDLVDALPAAIFGLDNDGMLAYMNHNAMALIPQALSQLGSEPDPALAALAARLRGDHGRGENIGEPVRIDHHSLRAWLCRLPEGALPRGELLVLIPAETTAEP